MNVQAIIGQPKRSLPQLAPGDTVKVYTKIIEGDKERTQVFQGTVIKLRHGNDGLSFTVRHVAYGIGVERMFPAASPLVEKVEVIRHGKVRRAKLYYLRNLSGKASRIKERRLEKGETPELEETAQPEVPAVEAEAPAQPAAQESAPTPATPPPQPEAVAPAQPEAAKPAGETPKAKE